MKRFAIACIVSFALLGLTWLWPSAPAMEPGLGAQGPVMKAHFIDVGQANATLLEFQCGVVLIDAGADPEHEEALVEFLNRFFDDRPALDRTIKLVLPLPLPFSPQAGRGKCLSPLSPRRGEGYDLLPSLGLRGEGLG